MSTLFKRKRSSVKSLSISDSDVNIQQSSPQTPTPEPPSKRKHEKAIRSVPAHISTFDDLNLVPPLLQTCKSLGYKQPTPIQKAVIPFLISNTSSHILALASTGSGKTATFVLPILHHLSNDPYGIYAVILTPTRELAKQIYEQVLALGAGLRVSVTFLPEWSPMPVHCTDRVNVC